MLASALLLQLTTSQEGATKPAWSLDGKATCFYSICRREVANFILSMEGGEPAINNFKYGANNPKWSPMVKKYYSHQVFHYKNYERFYFKSYTVPTWTMENQGLKRMNI
jgi:dipeptidyl aminopeptidase/acylaminoacyl peptidase